MEISRQVERSVLGGIQDDPLSYTTALLRRHRKTDRPHMATHGDDVINLLCRVDEMNLRVIDVLCELVKKGRRW